MALMYLDKCSENNVRICVTYQEELVVPEKSGHSNPSCNYSAPCMNLDNM
jgi:hypothetical protein